MYQWFIYVIRETFVYNVQYYMYTYMYMYILNNVTCTMYMYNVPDNVQIVNINCMYTMYDCTQQI